MGYVIGVDIGTQGTKAVLVDTEKGIRGATYTGYKPDTPRPLHAEQWPHVWQDAVDTVLKELMAKGECAPTDVKGLCISSLYGGSGIPVDDKIESLHPCLIWMDRRATDEVDWVSGNIDLDELFRVTGNYVDSYYGYTKIMWLKNNRPDVWEQTRYFLPPNAYIIHSLTGEIAVDYSSAGNIGGVFDQQNRRWSDEMMGKLGINPDYMPPRLVASSDIVGTLTPAGAERTGLAPGTPVMAGGVDAAVATLAAGALEPGTHVVMVGTSMCWGFITRESRTSPGLVAMPYVYRPEEYVYSFGGAITAGAVPSWFADQFGGPEREAARLTGLSEYKLLDMEAAKIKPGSDGLVMLPYFMGERSPVWDPWATGTLVGLNLTHTRAHMFRAVLEGVAYALRHNMEEVIGKQDLEDELILVGGAAKSNLWVDIFSNITGYPIRTIKEDVEAPLGDAVLAALGSGLIDDPAEMMDWFTLEERSRPVPEHREVYEKGYEFYTQIYLDLKDTMARMAGRG